MIGAKLARALRLEDRRPHPAQGAGLLGGGSWEFNVRAIYHGTRPQRRRDAVLAASRLPGREGAGVLEGHRRLVHRRASTNPDAAPAVAKAIDEEFSNSASETRTQTESAFAASMVKQMGNIEFLILAIGSVVFFTLLLVTGNTMAIAVRERTNELAVLKAIGYSDALRADDRARRIAADRGDRRRDRPLAGERDRGAGPHAGGILLLYLPPIAFVLGAVIALGTGFLAGVLPALSAMRLNVVQRASEDLTWRSRSSTTCAASRSAGRRRWWRCSASPGPSAVFVAMLALARGFKATLTSSGLPQNAIVQQAGADSEMTSAVEIGAVRVVEDAPQVARGGSEPLVSAEVVVIAALPMRGTDRRCQRADARRLAARARGARQRPHRPGAVLHARPVRDRRRQQRRARLRGTRPRAQTVRIGPGSGRSSASSTPAAAPSTRRSGPTPTS